MLLTPEQAGSLPKYDGESFLFPPRPETAIPKAMLGYYEKKGWIAQVKKNGTCSEIFVSPGRKVRSLTRHNETHKLWDFTPGSRLIFEQMDEGHHVLVAELLNNKVAGGTKDTMYIHDILVHHGLCLIGTTYEERHDLLKELFLRGGEEEAVGHWVLNDHAWLARNYTSGFRKLFDSLTSAEEEGLVLKDLKGKLTFKDNDEWCVKCRRSTKNFGF